VPWQEHGQATVFETVGVLEEHLNKTFTYPQDLTLICKLFTITPPVQPPNPSKEDYEGDMGKKMMWETSMKSYMKRTDLLESNTRAIYAIVWGKCSPMMQSKIESLDNFASKSTACDWVWLLKEIQGITHHFEGSRNVFISLDEAWSNYYRYRQGQQTLHGYLKAFQALSVLEHYGTALGTEGPYQEAVLATVKAHNPDLTPAQYQVKAKTEIHGHWFFEEGRPEAIWRTLE
jgi:hypothetical protein